MTNNVSDAHSNRDQDTSDRDGKDMRVAITKRLEQWALDWQALESSKCVGVARDQRVQQLLRERKQLDLDLVNAGMMPARAISLFNCFDMKKDVRLDVLQGIVDVVDKGNG